MSTGSLTVILGPMFSGKTTEIIRLVSRLHIINKNPLIINSNLDTRCNEQIKTHDNKVLQAVKTLHLLDLKHLLTTDNYEVIAIDEAQFFTDLYEFVTLALTYHKEVIVSGLKADSNQQKFGEIINLIPIADDIKILKGLCTVCNDGTLGIHTKRKKNNSDSQILVGNKDIYMCVCRRHLL